MGSAASASRARAAGARRPLARDICPGSQPGEERARCGGQAPRPGAAGDNYSIEGSNKLVTKTPNSVSKVKISLTYILEPEGCHTLLQGFGE